MRRVLVALAAVLPLAGGGCGAEKAAEAPATSSVEAPEQADGAGIYAAVRGSFCPPAIPEAVAARWCDLVTGYAANGSTLEVQTELYEDAEGEMFAEEILRPFMGEENSNGRDYGFERIVVTGRSGLTLADGVPLR